MLARGDAGSEPAVPRRRAVLHVHLPHTALLGGEAVARLEGHDGPVLVAQVRNWLTTPGTSVVVKPVVDLGAVLTGSGYRPPARIADQVALRDRTCVFPHCTRSARSCDLDHVAPYDAGGPTSSDNLAALCRRHHRLKTHHPGWTYRVLHPGTYLWTSPRGHRALRDPVGTHTL